MKSTYDRYFSSRLVIRSNILRAVDRALSARIPAALGYGIRVLATPIGSIPDPR